MPKPFYVVKNDIDHHKNVIQNAFYNFYYMKDVSLNYDEEDVKYTVSFFEKVSKIVDGKGITLGYFSPVIPEGQPSNVFNFQYGDLCKEHEVGVRDERIDGKLTMECGSKQEITDVEKDDDCTYSIKMTTPEMCSPKEVFSFLNENSLEVSDGSWWNYQINFFKDGHGSHIYKYHVGPGETSERVHLGSITDSLNADGTMQFTSGAVCKDEVSGWKTLPREGHIAIECGCEFALSKLEEVSQCQYAATVTHPNACSDKEGVPACAKLNLRAELLLKRTSSLKGRPSKEALGKYPHNLLHPTFTKGSVKFDTTTKKKTVPIAARA